MSDLDRPTPAPTLAELLPRLRAVRFDLTLAPESPNGIPARCPRPGFLLHSTLGLALRRHACREPEACRGRCAQAEACAYGRILEGQVWRPRRSGELLAEPAPSRLAIAAPWSWQGPSPTVAHLILLGDGELEMSAVQAALTGVTFRTGAARQGIALAADGRFALRPRGTDATPPGRVELRLLTPLRMVRAGRDLLDLDLGYLFRSLGTRIASWAHHVHGEPWPGPWPEVEAELAALRLVTTDLRAVRFTRYSARQRRRLPLRGLLGTAELESVGPNLWRLLRLAEVCGVGKGTSLGLGRIAVQQRDGSGRR